MLATSSAAHGLQHLGPWSRIGIYHPGPAWFYWSAPFFRLAGGEPWGMVLAASAGAALCAAAIVILVWRVSGFAFAAIAASVVMLGTLQLSALGLSAPWNPTILILPTSCGLVAVGAVIARGSVGPSLVAVLCGAVVAQSHLGTLPLGLAIIAGGILGLVQAQRRDGRPLARRPLALVVVVAAVPWLPVAYDSVAGPGNARATAEYLVKGTVRGEEAEHPMGISRALSTTDALRELASVAFLTEPKTALWAGVDLPAGTHHRPSRRSSAAGALCLGAAAWAARPRRRAVAPFDAVLARVALLAFALCALAALRVRHEFRPYLIVSAAGVGLVLWIAVALSVAAAMSRLAATRPAGRPLIWCTAATAVVVASAIALPRFDHQIENGAPMPDDPSAIARIRAVAPEGRVRFDVSGTWPTVPSVMSLTLELKRAGVDVAVRGRLDEQFGDAERDAPWSGALLVVRPIGSPPPSRCRDVTTYSTVAICVRS